MKAKRFLSVASALALVAIAILVFRPVLLDAIGSPYGAANSPEVRMLTADSSPHCELLADCETVSISNIGLDMALSSFMLALAGVVLAVTASRARIFHSWHALVPNPPPLFALS